MGPAILLAAALGAACGSGAPRGDVPPAYAAKGPAAAIDLVELPGGAPLATVVREGDPGPGLSLAVYAPGDPAALVGFAETLRANATKAGLDVAVRIDRDAAFFSIGADDAATRRFVEVAHAAISTPIGPSPLAADAIRDRLATTWRSSDPGVLALRRCTGQMTLEPTATIDPRTPEGARRIEALRSRMQIAFGFVGPADAAESVASVLGASGAWPRGDAPPAEPPQTAASIASNPAVGHGRLTVAVRVASASAATEAAARLGAKPSPIEARALVGEPAMSLARAVGVARPDGGCVALTFSLESAPAREMGARAASLVRATGETVAAELAGEPSRGAASIAVARSTGSLEASALAAWWALSSDASGAAPTVVAAVLETPPDASVGANRDEDLRALRAALGPATTRRPTDVPGAVRVERGQGEAFVLVASPCAIANEPAHRWGSAALSVLAAAAHRRADGDTMLEPYVDARALGFVAHASARPGEDPAALARRVADAAASAFFTEEPRADELLLAQHAQTEVLEARWGRRARGLPELGAGLGDHPSIIEPFGTIEIGQRLDARSLESELVSLARGPIGVAVLANADEAQGREALRAASRWFGLEALAPRACPALRATTSTRTGAHGGRGPARAHIVVGGAGADAGTVAGGATSELAEATAELLGGADGLLVPLFAELAGTTADARAAAGDVVIEVRAPDAAIDPATTKVLELVARLGRGEVPEAALTRALARRAAAERERLADPRERLARTLVGTPISVREPSAAELRAWLQKSFAADRAAVSVVHPD
jgi:hypothetical protein